MFSRLGSFSSIGKFKKYEANLQFHRKISAPSSNSHIDVTKLTVQKTKEPKTKSPIQKLAFGKEFTDHMLVVDWKLESGWEAPKIIPFQNLSLSPACSVFHYGLELFEGMKAYKDKEGRVRLFRPEKNWDRLNMSARRLALPTVNVGGVSECLKALLRVDQDWIPKEKGYSLYLRPTMIGTQDTLGVSPSSSAKFFIIASPVGPYFPEGFKPVKLLADDRYVRAWPGGTGGYKLGANYAPGILPQLEAQKKGYSQILWLLGDDHLITEVGTMNMFILWKNKEGELELVTPTLDGTILPGVTRDSIIDLARQWKEFKVTERPVYMKELTEAIDEGRILECFGAGTAAIVSPIKGISYRGKDYEIPLDKNKPDATIGPVANRFADAIMAIQYGETDSSWSVLLDEQNN